MDPLLLNSEAVDALKLLVQRLKSAFAFFSSLLSTLLSTAAPYYSVLFRRFMVTKPIPFIS